MKYTVRVRSTPALHLPSTRSLFTFCLAVALSACHGKKSSGTDGGFDLATGDMNMVDQASGPVDQVELTACGNGYVDPGEGCDDQNAVAGDGCSDTCQVEPGFLCPTPGAPCFAQPLSCGDGIITAPETCDDGNSAPGDGCDGQCLREPNYTCSTPGQPCVSTIICGNGVVDPGESCDTGEKSGAMGCSADCSQVTPGYMCPATGGACTLQPMITCPNAKLDAGETCDDGNTASGDGCSSTCQTEPFYSCPTPGTACTFNHCGDGTVESALGETCDDGNANPGDGCSASCTVEAGYLCPNGTSCTKIVCGDKKVQGAETCDDGNTAAGDGCSTTCTVEPGYTCSGPGAKCQAAKCGDGVHAGLEQCDDGNNTAGDGCSATCQLEQGFACVDSSTTPVYSQCHKTVCGDSVVEGFEQCDKGDRIPYDGCSPTCQIETSCTNGTCIAQCGDGLVFPGEACDDGNLIDGDGCSKTCTIEPGFQCANTTLASPASLTIPILYRDMLYYNTTFGGSIDYGHPDFQNINAENKGLVMSTLGVDNEPVWLSNGSNNSLHGAIPFCWWFHEAGCNGAGSTNPYDKLVYLDLAGNPTSLTLAETVTSPPSNIYQFGNPFFFPVDGLGWNANTATTQLGSDSNGKSHNFSFTSELHYIFTYTAASSTATNGPKFTFKGDDDVWAFINGKLVVDLGGVHGVETGTYTITTGNADSTHLNLTDGGNYSIDVFQAERHTNASNYFLTLSNFTHVVSACTSICGDGSVVGTEQCDNGAAANTGAYGGCTATCTLAPYCGDKMVQASNEQCDDGSNQVTYGGTMQSCGPSCKVAPYCGDGTVSNGELCDEGALNGMVGHCSATCTPPNSCGDGKLDGAEQCDDGLNNGASGDPCLPNCELRCGDGIVEPGEQCDNGGNANTGGYNGCKADCTRGPYCGDAVKSGSEQCDSGTANNTGGYGGCTATCTRGPYCGDSIVNGTSTNPETCDSGTANSAIAYGQGKCTNLCKPAPYCGDGVTDVSFGEACDGAGCASDCKSLIVN